MVRTLTFAIVALKLHVSPERIRPTVCNQGWP